MESDYLGQALNKLHEKVGQTVSKSHWFEVTQDHVDQYAEVHLTSDFKASTFGDKYLNFQHTF